MRIKFKSDEIKRIFENSNVKVLIYTDLEEFKREFGEGNFEECIEKYGVYNEDNEFSENVSEDDIDYVIIMRKKDFENNYMLERMIDSLTVCCYSIVKCEEEDFVIVITYHS